MSITADVSKEFDELKADLAELREDVASLVEAIRDMAGERARVAHSRVNEVGRRARARASLARDKLEHEIEERPLTSVITTFGIGFVLGMLLDRKR